jgi:endoglucanase Acf2
MRPNPFDERRAQRRQAGHVRRHLFALNLARAVSRRSHLFALKLAIASRRDSFVTMRCFILLALIAAACSAPTVEPRPPSPPPDPTSSVAVGKGFYVTKLVGDEKPPSDERGAPATPKVTADFTGVPTSNDWWSSLIWKFDRGGKANPYSEPMFAHPLAMQAERGGLAIAYPRDVVVDKQGYRYPFAPDLLVGAVGLEAADTRVARYSDWTVTAAWGDTFRATLGHGMPFVYVEATGGRARVAARGTIEYSKLDGEVATLTVHGHHYALFAPAGARWTARGDAFEVDAPHYSVAVLPDRAAATVATFRDHAHVYVTGGTVAWAYEPASSEVVTTYTWQTELHGRRAQINTPLVALYRHQWMHTQTPAVASYVSPRGEMKLVAASEVATRLRYDGVMPFLPLVDPAAKAALADHVDSAWRRGKYFPPGMDGKKDSYWSGKSLGRLAILVQLADQSGHTRARADLLRALQNELEDWFDGQAPYLFYYDRTWRTLIGLPSGYFSGSQLNDHHFHYGYFVFAAATVAQFDPAWAARYRELVELLIRDAASWDRSDDRFPFLRNFDVYAGHSWANGPALFANGNNEESSSEDVNFAVGTILWGAATGNDKIRDLGVFLHANLAAAIEQYWFDVDDAVFPKQFPRSAIAILWGDGGRYETWWDPSPVFVHGINVLPLTGGSMYLGRRPAYVKRNWDAMVAANRGEPLQWRDVLWMYAALGDGEGMLRRWREHHDFAPEFGNSVAAIEHWISTLAVTGGLDVEVTADSPTAFALRQGGARTYVGYNPTAAAQTVRFSDGARLAVPPRSYAHQRIERSTR